MPAEPSDWDRLVEVQAALQQHFSDLVLVGGSAAALHADHRVSLDADHVLADLRDRFEAYLSELERLAGWRTARTRPPVMILGNFHGVDTGIRQLRRSQPLQTEVIAGIRVPTLPEMVRVKAWMVVSRNATRDFLDLCALADRLGAERFVEAVRSLDALYPQGTGETVTRQLCKQLAEPRPFDLDEIDLSNYRGIRPPWNSWSNVEGRCRELSDLIAEEVLGLGTGDAGTGADGRPAPDDGAGGGA